MLDDNDNFKGFHIKKLNTNNKAQNKKIFDYTPLDNRDEELSQGSVEQHISNRDCIEVEKSNSPKSEITSKLETISNREKKSLLDMKNAESVNEFSEDHHRESSSNDNIGIK